jgi:hypothetical protein
MAFTPSYLTTELINTFQAAYDTIVNLPTTWQNIINGHIATYNNNQAKHEITCYVDKINGLDDGTNDGTENSPYRTISKAVELNFRTRTIIIKLKSDYLVSTKENLLRHSSIVVDLQGHQLQFRRRLFDTIANGGTMTEEEAAKYGTGWGVYYFYNVAGLKIICTGSNIILPVVKRFTLGNFTDGYNISTFNTDLTNGNSVFYSNDGKYQLPEDDYCNLYLYADDSDPANGKIGCVITVVDPIDENMNVGLIRINVHPVDFQLAQDVYINGVFNSGLISYEEFTLDISMFGCMGRYNYEFVGYPPEYKESAYLEWHEYSYGGSIYTYNHSIDNIKNSTFPALVNLESIPGQI